jgi:hypothetical protein
MRILVGTVLKADAEALVSFVAELWVFSARSIDTVLYKIHKQFVSFWVEFQRVKFSPGIIFQILQVVKLLVP